MAIAEVTIIPSGMGDTSVSKYVARAIRVLQREKDIKYRTTPMSTIIEGNLDKLLQVVRKMHEGTFDEEVARVATIIKIDDRRDKPLSMEGKINSLMEKLEHSVS